MHYSGNLLNIITIDGIETESLWVSYLSESSHFVTTKPPLLLVNCNIWLVVWNIFLIFYINWEFIIPTDELIFFRGVSQPPTRHGFNSHCFFLAPRCPLVSPQDRNMLHEQFLAMDRQKRGAPRDAMSNRRGQVVNIRRFPTQLRLLMPISIVLFSFKLGYNQYTLWLCHPIFFTKW